MNEILEPTLSKDETWKAHVLKAQASKLSDARYCKKNELSMWTFTAYKKKLGFTKPRETKVISELGAFVKAVSSPFEQVTPAEIKKPPQLLLPDAAWLAEFVRALLVIKK